MDNIELPRNLGFTMAWTTDYKAGDHSRPKQQGQLGDLQEEVRLHLPRRKILQGGD